MSTSHRQVPAGPHRVLILGAGYAGMAAATQLAARTRRADVQVTVVAAIGTVTYQGVTPHDMRAVLVEINCGPGLVFSGAGRVIATISFDIDADGRITTIHNVANPDKLRAVADGTAHHLATR